MRDFVHFSKFDQALGRGADWPIKTPLWVVLQLHRGVAYACTERVNEELVPGGVVIVPPQAPLTVLASQLGEANLRGMALRMSALQGLITAAERLCLEGEIAQACLPFCQLPASHALAERLNALFQTERVPSLTDRLAFLHAFAEWCAPLLAKADKTRCATMGQNPKARLQEFLSQMPESELATLSLEAVAKHLCCSDRHVNRLFYDVCGCSFRRYITELRLNKACQLLVEGEHKIIEVALDSGHSSLAQFNYAFKNHFGLSPSQWRERQGSRKLRPSEPALLAVA